MRVAGAGDRVYRRSIFVCCQLRQLRPLFNKESGSDVLGLEGWHLATLVGTNGDGHSIES